jgi:hypothetical protein
VEDWLFAIYVSWGLCPRPGAEGTQLKNNKMLVNSWIPSVSGQVAKLPSSKIKLLIYLKYKEV